MRILQVIHDFLPGHQAGSELYCYHLSKNLQRRGYEVRLLFTEIDHEREPYSTREDAYDGLPFLEIVNNHTYSGFVETYTNPAIEAVFSQYLDTFKPEVVHFHHLLGLSFGCVDSCRERNIPVVFTLHDYWLTCPRGGGQRYRGEGKVCHDVDPSLCAECISRFSFPARAGQRFAKKFFVMLEKVDDPTLLPVMERGRIESSDKSYVSRGVCDIGGDEREVLFAHPRSRITMRLDIPSQAVLHFAIAMDPSTYDKPGEGVLFKIECEGRQIYERAIDAKKIESDRGWREETISLNAWAGKKRCLVFETAAHPTGRVDYCTACWAEPKIVLSHGITYRPSVSSKFRSVAELILTAFQRRGLKKQVERRAECFHLLAQAVNLFIAPSRFLRQKFIEYGVPPEKIVYSDYGIAPLEKTEKPGIPRYPLRFTFVGTLVEHKGLHVLIEAFNGLPHDAARLDVYGDLGEFTGYVSRIQSAIAHPGIHLRGRVENEEIARILGNTDALVVPSIWFENSPITIHEAFLARVPVITSRFGGMADLVEDGVNGLLFKAGDVDDLRRCLLRCIEESGLLETLRPDPASVKSLAEDAEWMEETYRSLQR